MKRLKAMMVLKWILLALVVSILIAIIVGHLLSTKAYSGPKSDHFNGKVFINPSGKYSNDLGNVFKYFTTRTPDEWKKNYETYVRSEPIPEANPDTIQYTFVNHSTFLIQYKGVNILTDPVWSKRCSPSQIAGPERMRPPGVKFEDLPKIDLVLISHNHYDHLDKNTIKQLLEKHQPKFITPLGVSSSLIRWGVQDVVELDWWQSKMFETLEIKAVPGNHFSSRGTFDRDKSLWAGFVISDKQKKIYFAGDTGYSDIFKEIGNREGGFDLSFIPIGAYLPRWFMSPIHISPDEAAQVHLDVKSKQSVAIHFGTFPLADDNTERAISDLENARAVLNIEPSEFIVPEEGHSYQK